MNQSWSVVIFGYNESITLPSVVESVNNFLINNQILDKEIIIIDDGSDDDTRKISENLIKKYSDIIYFRHEVNLGIGPALMNGYMKAVKENVVAVPADGQFDINELSGNINFPVKTFLSFFREDKKNYSLYRKFVTNTNQFINNKLLYLNIKDVNWVKAFKTKDLREIGLEIKSSIICSEICAKLNLKGYKAIEILSVYHDRTAGKSRGASIKTVSYAVKDILSLIKVTGHFKKQLTKN